MTDSVAELEEKANYTPEDLKRIGEKWLERIRASEKREDAWLKDARSAERAYLCDSDTPSDVPDFNILHSNVETIVPSIYNSTPVPDIRPRHNSADPAAKQVSDILERAIATQIDDSRLDAEIEKSAQDAFMAGRGVVRVKFDANVEGETVTGERLIYEVVSWADYRQGPAKRWSDVPWVAFRHCISQEEAERMSDEELDKLQVKPEASVDGNEDDIELWEIWCRSSGRVYLVVQDTARVLKIEDDPLGLSGFFPCHEPVQPVTGTSNLTPVCPYTVYKTLAEELDRQTRRINSIVSGLKVRGAFPGDAADIERLAQADDNTLTPIANIENLVAAGGLEKAVMWWPVDTAVQVLRELYGQREQTKQSIYEITGISDIIRGQGNASETATAQQIKTEWGSLRIKKMQRLIERQVRALFVISAEIITQKFTVQTLQKASGIQIDKQVAQMLAQPLDHYRIDVESDSTVRADMGRNRQEMSEFLSGTANFFATMAPVVQQAPQAAGPIVEMYASFARQFSLGKQAEDALEQFAEMAKQAASQPQQNPEAEKAKAEAEGKQAELQMKAQTQQAELQLKAKGQQQDAEFRMQEGAAKLRLEQERLAMDRERLEMDRARLGMELQTRETENAARSQEAAGQMAQGADVLSGMVSEAFAAVLDEIRGGNQALAEMMTHLGAAIQDGNSQIVGAMTAPKELIRDESGRPVGVRTVAGEQRVVN